MPQNTSPTLTLLKPEKTQNIFAKAQNLLSQKNYEQAIPLFKTAIEAFEASQDWEGFMEASYELVVAYRKEFRFSELEEVVDYILKIQEDKCLHLFLWKVRLYQEKGTALNLMGKAKEALQCFQIAQSIMEDNGILNSLFIGILLIKISSYVSTDNYKKAEQLLEKIAKWLEEEKDIEGNLIAKYHSKKGDLEFSLGKHKLAQQSYQEAHQLFSTQEIYQKTYCLIKIAKIQGIFGDKEHELSTYLKLANKYKSSHIKEDKYSLVKLFIDIGIAYNHLNDFKQALHYYENALLILEEISDRLYHIHFIILVNLGNVYTNSENLFGAQVVHSKQITLYEKAIEIGKEIFPEKSIFITQVYTNLAIVYGNLGDKDKALSYSQNSLVICRELLGENHSLTAFLYRYVGATLKVKNRYSEGLNSLYKALEIYKNKYGDTHIEVAMTYVNIASVFHKQKKLKTTLEFYQLAVAAFLPNYQETDFYHLPKIDNYLSVNSGLFLETLEDKICVLHEYFQVLKKHQYSEAIKALQASFDTCQLAIDCAQKTQQRFKTEYSKLSFVEIVPSLYELSIKIGLELFQHSKEPRILAAIFTAHESAKTLLLRSSMQENEAKIKASIDAELLEQEEKSKQLIETYLQKIEKEGTKGSKKDEIILRQYKKEHFNALQEYQVLIKKMEEKYPQYLQFKYDLQTVSVTALQRDLSENTVALSYFIGSEIGYIFVVTPDEYQVIPFEVPADFDQQIKGYLSSIHAQNWMDFTRQSYDLYCLLVKPIEDLIFDPFAQELRQLVILPSAALHYLPFETLIQRAAKSATPAFHQLDYLLNRFEIQYHYSATLYHQFLTQKRGSAVTINRPPKEHSIDFMGFAPIYTSDKEATQEALRNLASDYSRWATRSEALQDGTLAPLPFSEKEVQSIEGLFAQKGLNGQSFLYGTATKDHFKTLATNAKYLHIAAHGLTNDEFPKLSGIVFHPTENSTEIHDSVLSMGEMYQLRLQADLVVLSSCESGIGKLAKGEGMMAMNRSFLYAGAKNVIYTLFKVLDKPSSELCETLFEGILEGKSYGEALRQAKLALIQREDVDPKSWAGFVLLGA